eukprot:SAG31_NODE_6862_length_1867_cov_3.911199_1_plen_241_part_00
MQRHSPVVVSAVTVTVQTVATVVIAAHLATARTTAAAEQPRCPAGTFVNASGVECGGLHPLHAGNASAQLCEEACCAQSESSCITWQWTPVPTKDQTERCWAGSCRGPAIAVRVVTFSFLCPLPGEKYGTFIARCNALIEKVSSFRGAAGAVAGVPTRLRARRQRPLRRQDRALLRLRVLGMRTLATRGPSRTATTAAAASTSRASTRRTHCRWHTTTTRMPPSFSTAYITCSCRPTFPA